MERHGKLLVIIGITIVGAGILLWLLGDRLRFLGRLPGDMRIERENFSIYIPFTTMLLLSVALSLIMWIIRCLR